MSVLIKNIKISAVILAVIMSLSFASCTASSDDNSKLEPKSETQTQSAAKKPETKKSVADGKDVLVVYFSATGTTKGVAENIAKITDADIYEIVPEQKYTTADLDWNDQNSRTTKEQNDSSVRPKIAGKKLKLDSYKTVYIGYPIWWGEEPRIMDTFVESYDFSGKTVIPFCTSGGSGIGSSGANLEKNAKSGKWLEGERLDSSSDLESWVKNHK
jgi:flavodoxin